MLDNEKLLFDELYEKTKDCGRVRFVELLMTKERENKELKQKYLNAVVDYETTMFEKEQLKKQVENYKKLGFKHLQDKNNDLETQQKEFIKYLEDLIKQNETVVEISKYGLPKNCSKLLIDFYKEILKKYKSVIGIENDRD